MADPLTAQLPDGTTLTFDADLTPAEIERRMALLKQSDPKRFQPPPVQEESLGDFAKGLAKNFYSSGIDAASGAASAIRNLPTTLANTGKVGLGVAEKAFNLAPQHAAYADAAGQYYKDRFGDWEKIKKTAYKDPVGTLLDASVVLGDVAGPALETAGTATKFQTLADIGSALKATGSLGVPKVLDAAGNALKDSGVGLMARTLKTPKSVLEGVGKRWGPKTDLVGRSRNVAEGILKEGVNPNEKGMAALMSRVDASDAAGDAAAAGSTALVDTAPTTRNLAEGRDAATVQALGEGATKTWENAAEEWNRNPHVSSPVTQNVPTYNPITGTLTPQPMVTGRSLDPQIPFQTSRNVKRGTYRAIGDANFGELSSPQVQAMKAIASGLREGEDIAEPAIAAHNARTGELIDLRDVLGRAAWRTQNHSPFDLVTTILAAGKHPGMALAGLANRPGIASPLARFMYQSGRGATAASGPVDMMLRSALLARLAEPDDNSQQTPPNQ